MASQAPNSNFIFFIHLYISIILIYFISSINMSNFLFIVVMNINFLDWTIYMFVPIVKKSPNSRIIGSLIVCLPHEFVHYVQIIWHIIYYLHGCKRPFLYDINHDYPFPVDPNPPSLSVFLSGCSLTSNNTYCFS